MSSSKLSMTTVPRAALLAALVAVAGCSTIEEDRTVGWSPSRLYSEAKDELDGRAYDKAIVLYEKLEGRAAGTMLAQQAELEKAFAQYKSNEIAQSIATLDRFIKLHPAGPGLDYAMYLRGIVNFNDNLGILGSLSRQNLSERDQKAAKESYEAFRELTQRFPESKYTADAQQRMTYIVNSLAAYEVHVSRYYFSRGAYVAAINRAQIAISEFRDVPAREEAVYILMMSYDALGMAQLRDDTRRILDKSYPNSAFLRRGLKGGDADPWWKLW